MKGPEGRYYEYFQTVSAPKKLDRKKQDRALGGELVFYGSKRRGKKKL